MLAWWVGQLGPMSTPPLIKGIREDPKPAAHELLVNVTVCGICRTDLHLAEGDLQPRRPGVIPGHEAVGVVAESGKGSSPFKPGDRVGVAGQRLRHVSLLPPGDENLCYRALKRANVPAGGRLGIYGFGSSAHLTAHMAMHRGASICVMTRSGEARALALALGAEFVGGAYDSPPGPLDSAILFAPVGDLVPAALRALDRGGTLAIAGIHLSDIPSLDYNAHLFNERQVRSVTANTRADGQEFLALAAEIPLALTTTTYPLDAASTALAHLAAGRITGSAVLRVRPETAGQHGGTLDS